ncbi:hypothetical protein ACIQMR_36785 [Streptomyces sp. NPDC091376]|uniref:hypothetical protein n=1 Tax=Streptomyces sp. NPDC091376 TaxID=3365994 RepID=UPI0037F3B948
MKASILQINMDRDQIMRTRRRNRIIAAMGIAMSVTVGSIALASPAAADWGWVQIHDDGEWQWIYQTKDEAAKDQESWLRWCETRACNKIFEAIDEPYDDESNEVTEETAPNCNRAKTTITHNVGNTASETLLKSMSDTLSHSYGEGKKFVYEKDQGLTIFGIKLGGSLEFSWGSSWEEVVTRQTGKDIRSDTVFTEDALKTMDVMPGQVGKVTYTPKLQNYYLNIYGPHDVAYESSSVHSGGRAYYLDRQHTKTFKFDLGPGNQWSRLRIPFPSTDPAEWNLRGSDMEPDEVIEKCGLTNEAEGEGVTNSEGVLDVGDNTKEWKYFRFRYPEGSGCSGNTAIKVGQERAPSDIWRGLPQVLSPIGGGVSSRPALVSSLETLEDNDHEPQFTDQGLEGRYIAVECDGEPRSGVSLEVYSVPWQDSALTED